MFVYSCRVRRDETGVFVVTFPDIPAAITQGDTLEAALSNAGDALDTAVRFLLKRKKLVPLPRPHSRVRHRVPLDPVLAAKVALAAAQRDAGMSNAELGRRLSVGENEVRRMLDPAHGTKVQRIDDALRVLGRRLVVGVEAA